MKKTIKVALAGNPNVGKTSILNHIVGSNFKVGNWPGVTVERREGKATYGDYEILVVDLPGVYTLEPISEDEWIAYSFLTKEKPHVLVNIIETPNMERDLLLTVELLELELPMLIVLNMIDEAQKLSIEVDTKKIEGLLGVKVVKTNGRTGLGVRDILPALIETYEKGIKPKPVSYREDVEKVLDAMGKGSLETKHQLIKRLSESVEHRKELERYQGKTLYELIKEDRFAIAHGLYSEVVTRKVLTSKDITTLLDSLLLHPHVGVVIFLLVMFLLFKFSFDLSSPLMDWIDGFINSFISPLALLAFEKLGMPEWFGKFFSEAIIGGVGFVLTFTPLIVTIYFLLAILEFSGYLPRVAFLMDRFMHRLGLHGKSIIPLLLGFGCNVPAIVATRTMESRRDKLLVISMIPFMSCPARLVVFSFFASIFFKDPTFVIFSLYVLGILVALLTAFFLRRTRFKGGLYHFVMELPTYRLPTLRLLFRVVWVYLKDFLYRAGTLIFAASIAIWLLMNLPPGVKDPSESVAGKIGRSITPIFKPIGIKDWRISTSLIPAFLAREIVLSSMGTIYAVEIEERKEGFHLLQRAKEQAMGLVMAFKEGVLSVLNPLPKTFEVSETHEGLRSVISKSMDGHSALSFMIFMLVYTSCLGTVAVMWREAGKKFAIGFLLYSFSVAWLLAFVIYKLGALL
ncbi:MAG: ferrous iron transport protein B [Aquificaceae bacterium]